MATSTIFNFNFNNSEIIDSTGQWYNATTGTPTTEFIEHDGNTALFQPALTNGDRITPNPTMLRSYDPNFKAYTYTLEVQVCAVLNRTSNSSFILNFPIGIDAGDFASALGLWYNDPGRLEMWIDYASLGYVIHPVLIDFSTAGFDRWFSVRIERTVIDPNNPYTGATVKAYVDGAEVYNQTFTYAQSTIRGMIGPRLRYCENLYATGGVAIDNLKLTAGIAPSSVVDVSLANLQRNNANLLSFIKGKVPAVNDGTLTIQKNGVNVQTFTANQSTNATANITVPTAVSELTNDSGYLTSSSNLDASKLTSGTVDIARLPQGALERLVKVANEAARYALTTADVQLGDTVQQLDTGIMYIVTDADHLDSAAGYTEYTAGTAASVPWSGVTGKPTFAAVATSGAYSDLTGTPTIPTVNNATLTIQKNGTDVATFSANSSTNATANITVPTKTSDLTNDSGFITEDTTKIPLAGSNAISGSLIPATTDAVNLGGPSYQWNNAYIKSLTINGVACGDILTHNASEFVNVTTAQTIAGVKTFSSGGCTFFKQIKINHDLQYGKNNPPPQSAYHNLMFTDANDWWGSYIENVTDTNGNSTLAFYVRNTNEIHSRVYLKCDIDGSFSMYPLSNNVWNLGISTNKWKSFNGVNPGALSLPGNYINVDTTNWVLDGSNVNIFTPTSDGWLGIQVTDTVYDQMHYVFIGRIGGGSTYYQQNLMSSVSALWDSKYHGCVFIPVIKNMSYHIRCICDSIVATFYPCQGNV